MTVRQITGSVELVICLVFGSTQTRWLISLIEPDKLV